MTKYRIESWGGREGSAKGVDIIKIPDCAEYVDVEYGEDGKGRVTVRARYLVPVNDHA